MSEFISSFILNFTAELGDKTQIIAFMLAGSYGILFTTVGIFLSVVALQAIAVSQGWLFQSFFENKTNLNLVAGLIFLAFGILTYIKKEEHEDQEKLEPAKSSNKPLLQIALLFFVAELGDKTQIATLVKASTSKNILLTYLGAVCGLFVSNFIGIFLGNLFREKVKEKWLTLASSLIFTGFGIFYLLKAF
jgi:putative Ca2+/H+ antiporter (TMEM165/GDT1 family)